MCNVKGAYIEAGVSKGAIYAHRHRWRAFARRWDAALDTGYARLECALVENACNPFSKPDFPADAPITGMTAMQAVHLLHMHKRQMRGISGRGRRCAPPRPDLSEEEAIETLMKSLKALAGRLKAQNQWENSCAPMESGLDLDQGCA